MKFFAVNYNSDPHWITDYTDDYEVWDRSDDVNVPTILNTKKTQNVGHVDYDKLTWIVDNYDSLPDIFYWGKVNLWKSIKKEEFGAALTANTFQPLLTKSHKTYYPVCFYDDHEMYNERNDSWYVNECDSKYFRSYGEFARSFFLPNPLYLTFAPGGNYILTRDRVHRYGRDFYNDLRNILPYSVNPAEAHMLERTYYNLWK